MVGKREIRIKLYQLLSEFDQGEKGLPITTICKCVSSRHGPRMVVFHALMDLVEAGVVGVNMKRKRFVTYYLI